MAVWQCGHYQGYSSCCVDVMARVDVKTMDPAVVHVGIPLPAIHVVILFVVVVILLQLLLF
jgi:hypothetical protein